MMFDVNKLILKEGRQPFWYEVLPVKKICTTALNLSIEWTCVLGFMWCAYLLLSVPEVVGWASSLSVGGFDARAALLVVSFVFLGLILQHRTLLHLGIDLSAKRRLERQMENISHLKLVPRHATAHSDAFFD